MNTKREAASQAVLGTVSSTPGEILCSERIFGHNWICPGGEATTKEFLIKLGLEPGQRVLDVCCGTGGSAVFMARHYGVHVHGVDLSSNMIALAQDRLSREDKNIQEKVKFELADATKMELKKDSYDVIYSRDSILHIPDKEQLYNTLYTWLKPGGTLFVTDYCRADKNEQDYSPEFLAYVRDKGYDLRTLRGYEKVVEQAGFEEVQALDVTKTFISTLTNELTFLESQKKAFIKDFSEKDFKVFEKFWRRKLLNSAAGDQTWGMFTAKKKFTLNGF